MNSVKRTSDWEADNGSPVSTPLPRLGLRVSVLYAALYLHYGFYGFLPLWLAHEGSTPAEIGTLTAIPLALRLISVAPFSNWAGRRQRVRASIAFTALLAAALVCVLMLAHGPIARAIVVILFSMVWDQIPVLTDAYATMAVRRQALDFGRLRVWGSIGNVVSFQIAGLLVGLTGISVLPLLVATFLLLPVCVTLFLPKDGALARHQSAVSGNWREVIADRPLMGALIAASFVMGSHGVVLSFGAIQWAAAGHTPREIGLLNGVAVAAEIIGFTMGAKILGARDPRWMIATAALAAALRWSLMALNPSLPILLFAQSLQAVTSIGALLAPALMIAQRVPSRLNASAQGLNSVFLGAVLAAVTATSGLLWAGGLGRAYAVMIVVTLAALPFLLLRDGKADPHPDAPRPVGA